MCCRNFSLYFRILCTSLCRLYRVYRLPGPFPAFLSYAGGGWISEYWSFSFSRLCTAYKSTDYTAIDVYKRQATDSALADAMAYVIIKEGLQDQEFLDKCRCV